MGAKFEVFGSNLVVVYEQAKMFDMNIRIVKNNLVFDIHYKSTNSVNYVTYTSCHPRHQ